MKKKNPRRWKKVWTPEEDALLAAGFNAGQTARQIAKTLGRSRFAVMRRRENLAYKLDRYSPKRLWTPQEDAHLIVMLNAGQRPATIAVALGRSISAVHTRTDKLRARDAPLPPPRNQVLSGEFPAVIPREDPCPFITAEDRAWMEYWRQPRHVRAAQQQGASL